MKVSITTHIAIVLLILAAAGTWLWIEREHQLQRDRKLNEKLDRIEWSIQIPPIHQDHF